MGKDDKPREHMQAYAGRWVAMLQGRVVGQGGTPDQAREAAKAARHKEIAEISFMPPTIPLALPPLVERVRAVLPEQEIYLVGGAVRDALLGQLSHDLDFAVPANAIAIARRIANVLKADFYILDESFDAARVIVAGQDEGAGRGRDILDFSSYRRAPTSPGQEPAGPDEAAGAAGAIDGDLRGRDFTINAMAYDLRSAAILDPLGGGADLRAKTIRACSAKALDEDAVRILRGVRLAAALDFKIEPGTRKAMKAAANRLPNISAERQRDEIFKTLEGRHPEASLRALELLGTFPFIMPELVAMKGVEQSAPHIADVWEHTLSTIGALDEILASIGREYEPDRSNDLLTGLLSGRLGRYRQKLASHLGYSLNQERTMRGLLFFAALFHDAAKPETKSVEDEGRIRFLGHDEVGAEIAERRGRAFNLSNGEIERLGTIIRNHMRFHFHVSRLEGEGKEPSRRAIYRFFRDTSEAGIDLVLLGLADLRGTRGHKLTQDTWSRALDVARVFMENYWEKPEEAVSPARLVDGNDLMQAFQLEPGSVVGELLAAIREAQATGQISTRAEALEFGSKWLSRAK